MRIPCRIPGQPPMASRDSVSPRESIKQHCGLLVGLRARGPGPGAGVGGPLYSDSPTALQITVTTVSKVSARFLNAGFLVPELVHCRFCPSVPPKKQDKGRRPATKMYLVRGGGEMYFLRLWAPPSPHPLSGPQPPTAKCNFSGSEPKQECTLSGGASRQIHGPESGTTRNNVPKIRGTLR